jgi:glycerophosphoryl diester phosphodiesterase
MKSQPLPDFWEDSAPPLAVAHRGGDAAGKEKENSMACFKAAYQLGYRWFETDLVPTKDCRLLALHGRGFQLHPNKDLPLRMTIQRMTYEDIQQKFTVGGEAIVLFEDLLMAFTDAKFFVDPKTTKAASCLIKILSAHPKELSRVCVGSFFIERTLKIRRKVKRATGIEVCTSILGPMSAWPVYWAIRVKYLKPFAKRYINKTHAASMHIPYIWLTSSEKQGRLLVDYAHSLGLKLAVYTPNDKDQIDDSLIAGADVVMSDRIRLLKETIDRLQKSKLA